MIKREFLFIYLLLFSPTVGSCAEDTGEQWILVTAPAFRTALEPLCKHRKAQDMTVVVVPTNEVLTSKEINVADTDKLAKRINDLTAGFKGTSYVLLVGAVEPGRLPEPETKILPPLRGSVGRMKGQPTDNGYGSPGEGLLPKLAVGRFPARTEEEARQMVQKTLEYEHDQKPGRWRKRLAVLAGVPAFNPFVDRLVESLAMARLDQIDPVWSGRAIYHNPQSRFCVPDARLHEEALKLVQEGQAFTVYLGHSGADGFYAGNTRFLDREDWAKLAISHGRGVFATFGCNGCQLAGADGEGYGLAAIRNPRGPVAVFGSHGVCFAAMVQLTADGFFKSFFAGKMPARLGTGWLGVKAGLVHGKIDDVTFGLLDAVDGDRRIPQAEQRLEHMEMFVLLGDPALRLPVLKSDVRLSVPQSGTPGAAITVTGEVPQRLEGAMVRLTLERPPSSTPADLEPLPKSPEAARARVMMANFERANRFELVQKDVRVSAGTFRVTLEVPVKVPWPRLIVRAYAATDMDDGVGVAVVALKR
jgi:hypothetical protein